MTPVQQECYDRIAREVLIRKVFGIDTRAKQARLFNTLKDNADADVVGEALIEKFGGALSGGFTPLEVERER